MHYLIWIPDGTGEPTDTKEKVFGLVGLSDHVDNAEAMPSIGPTGGQGVLFCWRKNGPCEFKFDPANQDWIPASQQGDWAYGRYWVGIWKSSPPTPENLVRTYPYAGGTVSLGDETVTQWLVPAALELPQNLILMDDGSTRFEIQRRFHAFWMRAIDIAKRLSDGIPYSECRHFCVDALRINYRITPEVASSLRLFSNITVRQVINIVAGVRDG